MIRKLIRGAAGVATLPVYLLGNALMVPLLKRQLRRQKARGKRLEAERDAASLRAEAFERMYDNERCRGEDWMYGVRDWLAADDNDSTKEAIGKLKAERDEAVRAAKDAGIREGRALCAKDLMDLRLGRGDWPHMLGIVQREYEQMHQAHAALHGTDESSCLPVNIGNRCARAIDSLKAERDRARRWSALWHERAREYRHRWRYVKGRLDALDAVAAKEVGALAKRCTDAEAERDTLKARLAEAEKTVAIYGAALSGNAAYLDGADHYPADDKIQGWAAAIEHITRERDTLRREVDTLRRELKQADADHDAAVAELKARHREVLAERDARIASLQKHEGLELYRAAYRYCHAVNIGNGTMRLETGLARHEAVEKWEKTQQAK